MIKTIIIYIKQLYYIKNIFVKDSCRITSFYSIER